MIFNPFKIKSEIANAIEQGGRFARLESPVKGLDVHFIQFQKAVGNVGEVFGLGVSPSLKSAQIIAYFEWLERKAFFDHHRSLGLKSSNGIAAHKFRLLAAHSARAELYERDAFLAHWYSQIPFRHISIRETCGDLDDAVQCLASRSIQVLVAETTLGFAPTVCCFLIDEKTGGFCVGTSAGKGRLKDTRKAFTEAIINWYFGDYGVDRGQLMAEAKANPWKTLNAHRTSWLYLRSLPSWVKNSDVYTKLNIDYRPSVKLETIELAPFPIVVARSEDLLNLEAGAPSERIFALLTRRLEPGYKVDEPLPHPLF